MSWEDLERTLCWMVLRSATDANARTLEFWTQYGARWGWGRW